MDRVRSQHEIQTAHERKSQPTGFPHTYHPPPRHDALVLFRPGGGLRMQRSRGTLAARNITKSYGDTLVLEHLSLTVTLSSRVGVVGPNGIGKSTLLRLLAGVEDPDFGAISREPSHLTVAYLAQEHQAADLSGGEAARQKLEAILAADAEVLLLDEPTNDLDFAALELLDRFVERYRGGLVVVSHDRAFLEG